MSKKSINPNYSVSTKNYLTEEEITLGLNKGDRSVLSHAISLAESKLDRDRSQIEHVLSNYSENLVTRRIAITGPPGAGKSTFINSLISKREGSDKIAILTIDPSSPQSGGSILGDKTRMEDLIGSETIFIRPSAAGKHKGGVHHSTYESILLCEMAGFTTVIIETVGVGQSEFEVSEMVDLNMMVIQPGSGDDLQGIKRGIMELADVFIINKNDGEHKTHVESSVRTLNQIKSLLIPRPHKYELPILKYSSFNENNCDNVWNVIDSYFSFVEQNNFKVNNRSNQKVTWFKNQFNIVIGEFVKREQAINSLKSLLEEKIYSNAFTAVEALTALKDVLYSDKKH